MRFDIMTLFPDLVDRILSESIIGRAQKNEYITVKSHNIRDFSENKHKKVDDTPYGGGKGMLMAAPPIWNCHRAILANSADTPNRRTIFMSPQGPVLTQKKACELSELDQIIILCGHYEGVDQRILDMMIDEEISIGDYVLTGGELPACILIDCVARMVTGVLSDAECYEKESHSSEGLLEFPQYTRPYNFLGSTVPDVLLSGNHAEIENWRKTAARDVTQKKRPDLLKRTLNQDEK